MNRAANGPALRPLLALGVAVLAAHALLLSRPAPDWRLATLDAGRFVTRVLMPEAALESAAEVVLAPAPVTTTRRPQAPADTALPSARPAAATATTAQGPAPSLGSPSAADATAMPGGVPAALPPTPRSAADLAAAAVRLPASLRLRYKVTAQVRGLPVSGQGELTWRTDGADYEARLDVSALLMPTRTQRSTGRVLPEGIAPARFSDRTRSEEAAHFDRDKGRIVFSANRPEVALQAGAQDRLSVLLQLCALLAGDATRYPTGAAISLQTASTRDADLWKFVVEGTETLELPGGRLQAIRLQRSPRFEHDQKVEVWLAPSQDYLPVRIRLTQPDGATVDQEWAGTDRL